MENSLYVGLSRQVVMERAMRTVANNVANISTPGYRGQNPMFHEFISKPKGATEPLKMVYDFGQYTTTTAGPLQLTGGTYDVALNGDGFMGVQTPSGETQYTRAGNFTVNNEGQLVNAQGYPVAGNGGGAITIPQGTSDVKILPTGDVLADGNAVGQIMMVEFANLNGLKPQGNNLYKNDEGNNPTPALNTTMKQGAIEGSNVNSVLEMTRMIEISRDYQSTMRMVTSEDERQRGTIQKLLQTSG
jgi:flagellar basal-body rod protein FlgF